MAKITDNNQRIVAEILTRFLTAKNMDDVERIWDEVFTEYELCIDPVTDTPCSTKEYSKIGVISNV